MGKNHRGVKEFTKEQRLQKENRQLKQELAHLRKQIARLDGDRFETLRQIVADQEISEDFESKMSDPNPNIEQLKREWACNSCETGWLEITLYSKLGTTCYYRKCNNCDHRTKGKRYDANVKGIVKK